MDQKLSKHPGSLYKWVFESEADRKFARDYTVGELGKTALQTDDGTVWLLTATTPTWKQMDTTGVSVGSLIVAGTSKTTPVDADTIAISNSAASGILAKLTWANLKATLKTYLDSLYQALAVPITAGQIARLNAAGQVYAGDSPTPAEIGAMQAIASLTAGDLLYVNDSGILARLPKGSEGQSLKINASGYPEWVSP